jgi:DNA polymerase III subunit epsilon
VITATGISTGARSGVLNDSARLPGRAATAGEADDVSLDFTAIDFETANASSASACAVGLVRVRGGRVVDTAAWLIKPPPGHDRFFELNIDIHGIRSDDVADALGWSDQLDRLLEFVGDDVLVAHNAGFDMAVLRRACEATGDACPPQRYFCSLQLSRRVYDLESYRLPLVAAEAGYGTFPHHDALADALACAHIVVDSAERHAAASIDQLAEATGVRVSVTADLAPAALLAVA